MQTLDEALAAHKRQKEEELRRWEQEKTMAVAAKKDREAHAKGAFRRWFEENVGIDMKDTPLVVVELAPDSQYSEGRDYRATWLITDHRRGIRTEVSPVDEFRICDGSPTLAVGTRWLANASGQKTYWDTFIEAVVAGGHEPTSE